MPRTTYSGPCSSALLILQDLPALAGPAVALCTNFARILSVPLLQTVEVIDRFCGQWKRELRDDLLAIHSMAHTVVNGAALSAAPGDGSLPGAAYSVGEEFRE